MIIKGKRILLRHWQLSDLNDYYEFGCVKGVNEGAGQTSFENIEQALMRLLGLTLNENYFAIVYKNKVIGAFEINESRVEPNNHTKEFGFILSKEYWGKGLMSEAVNIAKDYLFNNTDVDTIYAGHFYNNDNSKRLLIRNGFKYVRDEFLKTPLKEEPIQTLYYVLNKE